MIVCLWACTQKLRKEEKRVVPSEEEDPPGRLLPDSSEPSTRHANPTHRGNNTGTGSSTQVHYLRTLLGRAGFSVHLPVSVAFLRSPVHPLDPSLFGSLEQDRNHGVRDESFCDRRLLFCLTNEILGQLLRPHLRLKPWLPSSRGPLALSLPVPTGVELLDRTWSRILAFPGGADCRTLQDIDELVGSDIPDVGLDRDGVEEEWEEIGVDIGRRILDSLVDETASGLRMSGPAAAKFDPVEVPDMVARDFT